MQKSYTLNLCNNNEFLENLKAILSLLQKLHGYKLKVMVEKKYPYINQLVMNMLNLAVNDKISFRWKCF